MILEKRHAYDEHKHKRLFGHDEEAEWRREQVCKHAGLFARAHLRRRRPLGPAMKRISRPNLYLSLSPSLVLGVIRYIIDRYGTVSL